MAMGTKAAGKTRRYCRYCVAILGWLVFLVFGAGSPLASLFARLATS
jgi:hypothetical protein